ncbi:MAG TPA: metallophosphoesterase, partial [Myxococcota bacterium]
MILALRLLTFLVALGVVVVGTRFVLRASFPKAWERWLNTAWRASGVATGVGILAWYLGRALRFDPLIHTTAPLVAVLLMGSFAVLVTSPLWGALVFAARRAPVNEKRRRFLAGAVGVVPASAALSGPIGAFSSSNKPLLREVEIKNERIPKALDGFKILQISDVHLGAFIDVSQVETVVELARAHAPDLVALTGDIADDFSLFPAAMKSVASLQAPLGMFAIIGNHEVYRGRDAAVRYFEQGGARFLSDEGVVVDDKARGVRFWLAGTDDPASLGGEHAPFYA